MPRQQTYGKRTRRIYDPLAAPAFSSSPEQTSKAIIQTDEKVEIARSTETQSVNVLDNGRQSRKPLGETSGNADAKHVKAKTREMTMRRQRCRKIMPDDVEDVENRDPSSRCSGPDEEAEYPEAGERERSHPTQVTPQAPLRASPRKKKSRAKTGAESVTPEQESTHGPKKTSLPEETPVASASACPTREATHLDKSTPPDAPIPSPEHLPVEPSQQSLPIRPTIDLDNPIHTHLAPLLAQSSHPQTRFSTWLSELSASNLHLSKIAEASFGEVYRLSLLPAPPGTQPSTPPSTSVSPLSSRSNESVIKIIALKPSPSTLSSLPKRSLRPALRRAEAMSAPHDVANEARLLARMSSVPGFTNFRDLRVLEGRPSGDFVAAFRDFDAREKARGREGTCFPDPGRRGSYPDTQLWAVIEMQDAGRDLERMVEEGSCGDVGTVWDLFWQVVLALAKGEGEAGFEHRDLHLGNICVRERVRGGRREDGKVGFTGLEATIIDYTLSRASMSGWGEGQEGRGGEEGGQREEDVAFHDLAADPAVFTGDATDEYQYEIYRLMRSALYLDRPTAEYSDSTPETTGRSWQQYHPRTNLVWLHLVIFKLLEQVTWPSMTRKKSGARKKGQKRIDDTVHQRDMRFEDALRRVSLLLEPENIGCESGIASAGDLVHLAIAEGWIDVEDVMGDDLVDDEDLIERLQELALEPDDYCT